MPICICVSNTSQDIWHLNVLKPQLLVFDLKLLLIVYTVLSCFEYCGGCKT